MGPFSEKKQLERADSIKRLLDTNPQLDDVSRAMWRNKAKNLALTEDEYNRRVKELFSAIKPQFRYWDSHGEV